MKTLRIAGLLVFALTVYAIADEAKSAPKNIPDFDVQGISMTECQCTAYACPCRSNGHPDHGSCDAASPLIEFQNLLLSRTVRRQTLTV